MRTRSLFAVLFTALTLLFASACGSSGSSGSSDKSDTSTPTDNGSADTDGDTNSDGNAASGDDIEVVETGVVVLTDDEGEDETHVAALLRNNTDRVALDVYVKMTTLGADGDEIGNFQTLQIDALLPGAEYPVGYSMDAADGEVAEFVVETEPDEWQDADGVGELTVGEVTIGEADPTGERRLAGEVTSSLGVDIERAEFLVVLRDADGTMAVVSSGYTDELAAGATVEADTPTYTPIGDDWTAEGYASPVDFDTLS